jgi:hypothetical protein
MRHTCLHVHAVHTCPCKQAYVSLSCFALSNSVLQKRYFMMCNDWFKGASERKLEPGKVPENGICTYRVVVHTSDLRGAGTDANVTMQLFGAKGDTGERKLDNSTNNF